jgi:urease accessory protein
MAAGLAAMALPAPPALARLAEPGIVASLIVIGTLVALGRRRPAGLEAGILLAAGLVHGLAHAGATGGIAGSETMASLPAGVLLGTAALHGMALLAGRFAMGRGGTEIVRAGGAATAMLGMFALIGPQL